MRASCFRESALLSTNRAKELIMRKCVLEHVARVAELPLPNGYRTRRNNELSVEESSRREQSRAVSRSAKRRCGCHSTPGQGDLRLTREDGRRMVLRKDRVETGNSG